jgi:hypothetical protein
VRLSRAVHGSLVVSLAIAIATSIAEPRALALDPPPPPPWRAGPDVDATLGIYAPLGKLKRVSAPGPWMRLTAGYEVTSWLGIFAAFDSAFLATNRANPPPGERGYVLWGFGGGARFSLPLTPRWRIPLRVEIGAHKVDDQGVLQTYGFSNGHSFGLSYGAMIGVEWRATSRHFGIAVEWGVRNDAAVKDDAGTSAPLAMLGGVLLRYTL